MRILKVLRLSVCVALLSGALGTGARGDDWSKKKHSDVH